MGQREPSGQVTNVSLPALKIEKKINFLFAKAVDHVLVMNLKDWIECLLQLN